MKLKVYDKVIFWWDVVFTVIDNWQLRRWNLMVAKRDELVYAKLSLTKLKLVKDSDVTPLEEWTD